MAVGAQNEAQPPPPFPSTPVRLVPYSQPWHIAKIVLRGISVAICIVVFALCGVQGTDGVSPNDTVICLPPTLTAFFWNGLEFVTLLARRKKQRGIHPGIIVAAELVLCGGMLASVGLLSRNISLEGWWYYWDSYSNHEDVEIALLTMMLLLVCLHFTLFVRACRETHERNKTREKRYMVYIPGGGGPFSIEDTPYGQSNVQAPPTIYRAQLVEDDIEEAAPQQSVVQKEIMPSNTRYLKK